MKNEDLIISYLQDMSQGWEDLQNNVSALQQDMTEIRQEINDKIDTLEQKLNDKIDTLEQRLDDKMDTLEQKLNDKMDALEQKFDDKIEMLDQKLDSVEMALDTEIDSVYHIALENKRNIEILLIPFNDRNLHINEEVARIPKLGERVDRVETVVGKHSKEIRELQSALA